MKNTFLETAIGLLRSVIRGLIFWYFEYFFLQYSLTVRKKNNIVIFPSMLLVLTKISKIIFTENIERRYWVRLSKNRTWPFRIFIRISIVWWLSVWLLTIHIMIHLIYFVYFWKTSEIMFSLNLENAV